MRPVHVQFVAPRAWKAIWLLMVLIFVVIAGGTGWHVWQQHQAQRVLRGELENLQATLKANAMPVLPEVNPRAASEKMAQRLLQRDWNRVFDTIENPDLAKVRLVDMSFDSETGDARLDYELESMSQGPAVTAALNAFGGASAWRLEQMTTGRADPRFGNTAASKIRGIWRARLQ